MCACSAAVDGTAPKRSRAIRRVDDHLAGVVRQSRDLLDAANAERPRARRRRRAAPRAFPLSSTARSARLRRPRPFRPRHAPLRGAAAACSRSAAASASACASSARRASAASLPRLLQDRLALLREPGAALLAPPPAPSPPRRASACASSSRPCACSRRSFDHAGYRPPEEAAEQPDEDQDVDGLKAERPPVDGHGLISAAGWRTAAARR